MSSPKGNRPDLSALSAWAPQLAEAFVSLASDIALVLDSDGTVLNVAQGADGPLAPSAQDWVGHAWADTVTGDTRAKVDLLLKDVVTTGFARRREVNHPSAAGVDVPVAYTALRLGEHGPVLVVGRDLRAVAAIQQRFVDAQRELEQGYWRTRQSEARYRLLFQVATDAVMIVDPESLQILEVNQAAASLFDIPAAQMPGRPVTFGFDQRSRGPVEELLLTSRRLGRPAEIRARLFGRVATTHVAATPFRADDTMRMLVRVRPVDTPETSPERSATLARVVDAATECIVVTDSSGRVQAANPAFLKLLNVDSEADLKGRPLQDWVVDADSAINQLVHQVRRQGLARQAPTRLRTSSGQESPVDLSAALLAEGDQECIGFTFRVLNSPVVAPTRDSSAPHLGQAVERLATRLGELTLPDILREVGDLVERHVIQAAARHHEDDTATARHLGITSADLDRRRRRVANRHDGKDGSAAPEAGS